MKKIKMLVLIQVILVSFNPVFAQKYNAGVGLGKASEFVFQTYKNQQLISVRLLGAVKKAGVYHVPKDLKLLTLLSLAGGTTKEADIEEILIGNENVGENKKISLYDAIGKNSKESYLMKSNDIVLVKRKRSLISGDTWKVISLISVMLTTALTAIVINDKI